MRSTVAALTLPLLVLAGCGGTSPAEEAFLAELQEAGPTIELTDPDGDLSQGREVCQVLEDTKPDERYTALAILDQQMGFSFTVISAAQTHLCPEIDVPGPGQRAGDN